MTAPEPTPTAEHTAPEARRGTVRAVHGSGEGIERPLPAAQDHETTHRKGKRMTQDDRMETITDPAEIRATDEPDERTTPAPSSGAGPDLGALHETICDNFTGMAEGTVVRRLLVAGPSTVGRVEGRWGPMSADRLAEIKTRAEAATKGPWSFDWSEGEVPVFYGQTTKISGTFSVEANTIEDAEFIAAAREDVPWLIECIGELNGAICWDTTCLNCSSLLDSNYDQYMRAEIAEAEVERLTAERDALAAQVARAESLAEEWRYKGQFGWGPWQIGEGPDPEGYVMDHCAFALRDTLAGSETDTSDNQTTGQEVSDE